MNKLTFYGLVLGMILMVGCTSAVEGDGDIGQVSNEEVSVNDLDEADEIPLNPAEDVLAVEHGELIDGALVCIPESMNEEVELNFDSKEYLEGDRLQVLLDNVRSGGPPPDGIPPIDEPNYYSMVEAEERLIDEDVVFVLELEDETYIFPQNIMVWHEIVNLKEENMALTYCPLTGSAITYTYPEGYDTTFGTSGSLLNSNLLMYDRATESYISQIDGIGLNLELQGLELNTVPTFWTTWGQAKANYRKAKVLNTETGHTRSYWKDPYGSYTEEVSGNYYTMDGLMFDPLNTDEAEIFHSKYTIIGVKAGNERLAIDPDLVKLNGEIEFSLSGETHKAVYDENLDTVRVYIIKDGETINAEYFSLMWFAWYGLYPETEVM